jgi:hypothetical protein
VLLKLSRAYACINRISGVSLKPEDWSRVQRSSIYRLEAGQLSYSVFAETCFANGRRLVSAYLEYGMAETRICAEARSVTHERLHASGYRSQVAR